MKKTEDEIPSLLKTHGLRETFMSWWLYRITIYQWFDWSLGVWDTHVQVDGVSVCITKVLVEYCWGFTPSPHPLGKKKDLPCWELRQGILTWIWKWDSEVSGRKEKKMVCLGGRWPCGIEGEHRKRTSLRSRWVQCPTKFEVSAGLPGDVQQETGHAMWSLGMGREMWALMSRWWWKLTEHEILQRERARARESECKGSSWDRTHWNLLTMAVTIFPSSFWPAQDPRLKVGDDYGTIATALCNLSPWDLFTKGIHGPLRWKS